MAMANRQGVFLSGRDPHTKPETGPDLGDRLARRVRWGRRFASRQAARVGTVCQRMRLQPVAEWSLRTAIMLEPHPATLIRLGRLYESGEQWTRAAEMYERSVAIAGESPGGRRHRAHGHYRQARMRARLKDWEGAEAAFAQALELRPDVAVWHLHQGEMFQELEDWAAAAKCFGRAAELHPEKSKWRVRQIDAYRKGGHPDQAIDAALAAKANTLTDAALVRSLAAAYDAVGDWRSAAALLSNLVSRRPDDYTLRMQLVDCLEQLYLVPFSLDHHDKDRVDEEGAAADAPLTEAVDHLRQLTAAMPERPGATHRLGLLFERSGQLLLAADAYRLAMKRLVDVDSWWCHRAAHEWEFRLAYIEQRQAPSATPREKRLTRYVATSDQPSESRADPAGFFDAVMYRHGLQISGFLRHGLRETVDAIDICLDDQLLKRVSVDPTAWRPTLRYDLTHGLMNDFPERALLSLHARGRPLATVGGKAGLEVVVRGGNGKISTKLSKGLSPTKKGTWPRTGANLVERQERYLKVYDIARKLLEGQGRKLWLCYGTLLGCHREGRFIPGDDDFDVSYVSTAPNASAFRRETLGIALELLRQGLDTNLSINGRLFKVGLDGVWIDVTPLWFFQGRAWAFDAHDVPLDSIVPVRRVEFLGHEVYVPRNPAVLLEDTYGPQWRIPQPQFRYYRSPDDNRVLSQMWAKPSEVREFARQAASDGERFPAAGKFVGVGYPGYPGFSWLTMPDGPKQPAHDAG